MGEIFSSLQIFGSLSIFGVSDFISKRLIFQCYFRNREGERKRETPAFNFHLQSFKLSCQCMAPFPLRAPGQKGNARVWTGLWSSGEAKGLCSHSVVGAFRIAAGTHFRPCCVSRCLRKSTFRWKPLPHRSQPKGLKPVCFRLWVMRLEL